MKKAKSTSKLKLNLCQIGLISLTLGGLIMIAVILAIVYQQPVSPPQKPLPPADQAEPIINPQLPQNQVVVTTTGATASKAVAIVPVEPVTNKAVVVASTGVTAQVDTGVVVSLPGEHWLALLCSKARRRATGCYPRPTVTADLLKLLNKKVQLALASPANVELAKLTFLVYQHPQWVMATRHQHGVQFALNKHQISQTIKQRTEGLVDPPETLVINQVINDGELQKTVNDHPPTPGLVLNLTAAAERLAEALKSNRRVITLRYQTEPGTVTIATDQLNLKNLTLLATGRSSYYGSDWGRSKNVKKALREHLHNVLVPPGADFSFNSTLNGAVSTRNGWAYAKIIGDNGALVKAPGGGICQASTTLYRAIMYAGLPIKERKSHSLYVHFYKEGGLGMDATIFPDFQDLVFNNDTGHHLLIQAHNDAEQNAFVSIYGIPDGRLVEVTGPHFYFDYPRDLFDRLSYHDIGWVQRVAYPDGQVKVNPFASRYRQMPAAIVWRHHQAAKKKARLQAQLSH